MTSGVDYPFRNTFSVKGSQLVEEDVIEEEGSSGGYGEGGGVSWERISRTVSNSTQTSGRVGLGVGLELDGDGVVYLEWVGDWRANGKCLV